MDVKIINHTHWDREWYKSADEFKFRLRDGINHLVDMFENGEIEKFFLDGQTVMLEDYQGVVSQKRYSKLLNLIREKKIEVGPWYVLADEFLVSGESLVRNLKYGIEMSKEVGSRCDLGYLPDTFGHISQMPQLLKKSGIHYALIFRGTLSDRVKNEWEGADGTKLFTFVLPSPTGYFQPELLSTNYVEQFEKLISSNQELFKDEEIFILNGADHIFPAKNLQERKAKILESLDMKISEVLPSELIDSSSFQGRVGKISGEQRNNEKAYILPGVTSARNYLKRQNQEAEDLLTHELELLDVYTKGYFELTEYLDYLWKTLLKNHPHDSICGCSTDFVHREMEVRSEQIFSGGRQMKETTLLRTYDVKFDGFNNKLFVLSPTPYEETKFIKAEILVPVKEDLGSIELFEGERKLSFDIVKREAVERLLVHQEYLNYHDFFAYEVVFNLSFNGFEERVVVIKPVAFEKRVSIKKSAVKSIENKSYQVNVNEHGFLDLYCKAQNRWFRNLNKLVSSLDRGDEYNYSAPEVDKISMANLVNVERSVGVSFSRLRLTYELVQPEGYDFLREVPSDREVKSKIVQTLTLSEGYQGIHCHITVDNKAKNHRLLLKFPLGERIEYTHGDSAFDIVKREISDEAVEFVSKGKETPVTEFPALSAIKAGKLILTHRGLLEYSVEDSSNLCLTLLRCVGDLSRRDLASRNGGAGPSIETPEAQILRCESFEFMLSFLLPKSEMVNVAKSWRVHSLMVQASGKTFDVNKILKLSNRSIVLSALKRCEEGMVARLFNASTQSQEVELELFQEFKSVEKVTLLEEFESTVLMQGSRVKLKLAPKEIVTLKFSN